MVFSEEDKHIIMSLRENKQFSARRFSTEFPNKNSARNGLDDLMKKIDTHAAATRLSGNGRPRTACTVDNVDVVEELVMSWENQPNHTDHFEYTLLLQSRHFEVSDSCYLISE